MTDGSLPALPPVLAWLARDCTIGSTKARVLPQPVRARPTTSVPSTTRLKHAVWIANRASMPLLRSSDFMPSDSLKLSRALGSAAASGSLSDYCCASDLLAGLSADLSFLLFFLAGCS